MRALAALLLAVLLSGCTSQAQLTIGSTTSTRDSGLFDVLLPAFRDDTGIEARFIAVGTGEAIELARRGDVDVLVTHSRAREEAFVAEGGALWRSPVMYNRYTMAGPAEDPAGLRDAADTSEVMQRLARGEHLFASRGDRSGTHDKELALWRAAGLDASTFDPAWYKDTGSGMAATLRFAAERRAYVLTDEATFAQLRGQGVTGSLASLCCDEPPMWNQYGVLPVNATRHPQVRADLAVRFADWLTGDGQNVIGAYTIHGQQAFVPNAGTPEA